jgi:TonB family protein
VVWLALLLATAIEPHFSAACEALKPVRVISNDIEPPVLIHRVQPRFVRANAVVIVGTIIDPEGNVCDAKVVKGAGRAANAASIAAVRQWKFTPMRWHGETRACVFYVTVNLRTRARGK